MRLIVSIVHNEPAESWRRPDMELQILMRGSGSVRRALVKSHCERLWDAVGESRGVGIASF